MAVTSSTPSRLELVLRWSNAISEHLLGSVRCECLDHIQVIGEHHLRHVLKEYVAWFNYARPHQGIQQQISERSELATSASGEVE